MLPQIAALLMPYFVIAASLSGLIARARRPYFAEENFDEGRFSLYHTVSA